MAGTEVRAKQIKSINRDDLDVATVGKSVVAKLVAGTGISLNATGADAGTGDVTINVTGGSSGKRYLVMGFAGTVPIATVDDMADFPVVVPVNLTLEKLKIAVRSPVTAATTVQVRRSTDDGATYSNAFGSAQIAASGRLVESDPANLDVDEGDFLNFSVTVGGGTGVSLQVVIIGIER